MKANTLAVVVPNKGCNKEPRCPYCVVWMTGFVGRDFDLMKRNAPLVKEYAKRWNVQSVIITGKGEPTVNLDEALDLILYFRGSFSIEFQTNGIDIVQTPSLIKVLIDAGVKVFAFSVDREEDFEKLRYVTVSVKEMGAVVRLCVAVTDLFKMKFEDVIKKTRSLGAQQLTFRNVTVPEYIVGSVKSKKISEWIGEHKGEFYYYKEHVINHQNRWLRQLGYGTGLYDIQGIGVAAFDFCVQDAQDAGEIRSLIFHEDGHLYTAWNSPASIIF